MCELPQAGTDVVRGGKSFQERHHCHNIIEVVDVGVWWWLVVVEGMCWQSPHLAQVL